MHVPSQPLDPITAFAVPKSNFILAERSVFGRPPGYPYRQIGRPISDRQNFI